ncbi:hypothetical protein Cadr_000008257 [Camelus dromedarius]|uniref:Uncharacterized protein n=1 Tax=Camelus dromedarius TaxID=9838 RepID=A0A5N4DZ90_CAMDR|nr:hypothetical protein Cadr_000008257 [Camelus dromedarius]
MVMLINSVFVGKHLCVNMEMEVAEELAQERLLRVTAGYADQHRIRGPPSRLWSSALKAQLLILVSVCG